MVVDPVVQYCSCGHVFKPRVEHKIIMLMEGEYRHVCPDCGVVMVFELMNHVVKVDTLENKDKWKIWKTKDQP